MNLRFQLLGAAVFLALCCQALTTPDAAHNQYVVMMRKGMQRTVYDNTVNLVRGVLGANDRIHHTYFFSDFRGFSIEAPAAVIERIRRISGIELIEPNYVAHAHQTKKITQSDAGFGLDRISHHSNALTAGRSYEFIYYLPAGKDTTVYVLDSGVYLEHNEFQGRATFGQDFAPPNVLGHPNNGKDYNGHGTCCASVAAGYDYGVAKYANIVDVRILNDNGSTYTSSEVAGIDYAVNEAENRDNTAFSVINFSVGGPSTQATQVVNYAIQSAVNAGVFCGLSAGNSAEDAGFNSPGNTPDACTIGATADNDEIASFSNYGDLVDMYAPGVNVRCAGIANKSSMIHNSGTSFSAPYVTGLAAYLKSFNSRYSGYTPQRLCRNIAAFGSKDYIKFRSYTKPSGPNIIAYDQQGEE